MCLSAALIAGVTLLSAGAQAMSSISTANNNRNLAVYENAVRTKQLNEKRNIERLSAIEAENIRTEDFNRTRSTAFAAIGASGLGENISFFQAVDPEQKAALLRDVRNIRLNLVATQSSIRDEIQVGAYGVRIAKANASAMKVGAIAEFAKSAMNAATFYGTYAKPGG